MNERAFTVSITLKTFALVMLLVGLSAPLSTTQAQCNCGGSMGGTFSAESWMMQSGEYGQIIDGNAVNLTLHVPESAIVQINGDPTISIGPTRYYVIRNLEAGREYEFKIVVETANAAGVAMEETKTVKLLSGYSETITMKPIKRKVIAAPAAVVTSLTEPQTRQTSKTAKALKLSTSLPPN